MTKSRLSQVLECFETAPEGLSIPALARDLELSPRQIENLVEYWVRRGRIQIASQQPDCGICRTRTDCAFLTELPKYYELVPD